MDSTVTDKADRPSIAVVGFSVRAAVQCAVRGGFDVVAVDACADRDLIAQCSSYYPLANPNWPITLNQLHPKIPLLLAGGMEHRTGPIDMCHLGHPRFAPTGQQISAMRSLDNWAKWAIASDINWPKTIREFEHDSDPFQKTGLSAWLVKPYASVGGVGTSEVTLRDLPFYSQAKFYVQERRPGENLGVTFLSSVHGSTLVGATAAWAPIGNSDGTDYTYRGSVGPVALTAKQIGKLQRFASIVGKESGLLGIWQADFVDNHDSLTLLENNPRWSASMELLDLSLHHRLVGMHYACICLKISLETFEQFTIECCQRAKDSSFTKLGKLIVYAPSAFEVSPNQAAEWWSRRWQCDLNAVLNQCQVADIPVVGTVFATGDPVLTLLVAGDSAASILSRLLTEKSKVFLT